MNNAKILQRFTPTLSMEDCLLQTILANAAMSANLKKTQCVAEDELNIICWKPDRRIPCLVVNIYCTSLPVHVYPYH